MSRVDRTIGWAKRLREGLDNRGCRLPTGLTFTGEGADLTIRFGDRALRGNMQEDAAAFEAWALAFLVHGGAERVTLQLPVPVGEAEGGRHLQRLLYRLDRFCDLFPDEVRVEAAPGLVWSYTGGDRLVLNQPLGHREAPAEHGGRMAGLLGGVTARESDLELALEVSPGLKEVFRLDKVMRQWPVGLFRGRIAAANHVFTGGKSAIDLVGLRGSTLVLFELKRGGNAKAGILSELLFYASVMRDTLGRAPHFFFDESNRPRNCVLGWEDVAGCKDVEAVMLAPRFHPVVTSAVLERLNGALARRWCDRPVTVTAVEFAIGETDFLFAHKL